MTDNRLYVINASMNPNDAGILDGGFDYDTHQLFLKKVQEKIQTFNIPYLAFFDNGVTLTLQSLTKEPIESFGVISGRVVDGVCPGGIGDGDCTLAEYVNHLVIGLKQYNGKRSKPITGIVEFSPTELYPEAMKDLSKRYQIEKNCLE